MRKIYPIILFFICLSFHSFAQSLSDSQFENYFKGRGEVYFSFHENSKDIINQLSKIVSIDHYKNGEVFAYANKKEFNNFIKLGIDFQVLTPPSMVEKPVMKSKIDLKSTNAWDFYPTYEAYESMMFGFQTTYPQLCRTETLTTLNSGRKIMVVHISQYPDSVMNKPKFLYSSSIHGDEVTGYVLMLRFIDYLLSNYGTDPRVTNLVNSIDIYIVPAANPDGTYMGGNSTVYGAERYNANFVDLNRNYPDPVAGPHPDGEAWQPETVAFMAFANQHHINMSANFHGGAEVVNYPWDTWQHLHADDCWWNYVAREYADTVHIHSTNGYFTDLDNGVTNGYAWYTITGGRQDYMTYFQCGRECTIEISSNKTPPAAQLPTFWNANYRSFLNYLEESLYGINGIVTDSVTGTPLKAKIYISGHDLDSSWVYSQLPLGNYFRYLCPGNYTLKYTCTGYYPKEVLCQVVNHQALVKDVKMVPVTIGIQPVTVQSGINVFPNPTSGIVYFSSEKPISGEGVIQVYNSQGMLVLTQKIKGENLNGIFPLSLSQLSKGIYWVRISTDTDNLSTKVLLK